MTDDKRPADSEQRHERRPSEIKRRLELAHGELAFLELVDEEGIRQFFTLDPAASPINVGRDPQSDVPIDWDGTVSRTHVLLDPVGSGWRIEDVGTRNGTFVNGKRIETRHRLKHGDRVRVGETELLYAVPGGEVELATTKPRKPTLQVDLTQREREVLVALCRPMWERLSAYPFSNQEIAERLNLSLSAVKEHIGNLLTKFKIDKHLQAGAKRVELANRALDHDVLTRSDFE